MITGDSSKVVPDIQATVLNLRQHFDNVRIVWGKPDWINQDYERTRANLLHLKHLSISPENLFLVRLNAESESRGSIQFLEAEVFVTEPKWIVSQVYELHNILSDAVVYVCSR